jgi:HK97 family phage major capsid protein
MSNENKALQELHETISEMKKELDSYRAQTNASKMIKKAEEEAEERAKRLFTEEQKEAEMLHDVVEKMTQERLEKMRTVKKIEFPIAQRSGNLSKVDKQLLDVVMGRKVLAYDGFGTKSVMTTTTAAEWNPTDLANEVLRAKAALTRVRGALRVINMTSNPFKVPIRTGPADVSAPGEASAITENTTDFVSNVTLTASKLAANVPVSTEEGEDAIIAVLPEIRMAIAEGLAKAEDEFFLNGTINNGTAVSGSGITGGAGVTKQAGAAGTTDTTVANFDTAMADALRSLGVWGIDPSELLFFVGINTYYKLLYNNTNIQQVSQYGDRAVLLTGEVGKYKGIPILVTSGVRSIADGGANTTNAEKNLILNRSAVLLGDRRTLTIKSQDYIDSDITKLVGTERTAYSVPFGAGVAQIVTHLT